MILKHIGIRHPLHLQVNVSAGVLKYSFPAMPAMALAACDFLRKRTEISPIVWLCDREEFQVETRMRVGFFYTGSSALPYVQVILKTIQNEMECRRKM